MKDNLAYLQVLAKCKPKIRKAIIDHGPADVIMSICECTYNLLKGTIPISSRQKQRLSRYKKHLRSLADKKVSRIKKKRLLNQKGGKYINSVTTSSSHSIREFVAKMKHAKRMVLVPEDVFARFEQKQKLESSPIVTNMIKTDSEMSNILQRTDMDDTEKQKLYYTNLERYLNLRQQKDNQIPTVQLAMKNNEKDEDKKPAPQETMTLSDSVIVDNIPKSMRQRAKSILNCLKTRPDMISWDETGQVKLNGVQIPYSNISDLIGDAVRSRKNFNPNCSKEFFRVLAKINMPKDLVRNDKRWEQAQLNSSSGEEKILYISPSKSTPKDMYKHLHQNY
jgi:hypothetical protein